MINALSILILIRHVGINMELCLILAALWNVIELLAQF